MNVLGIVFSEDFSSKLHIESRINNCRRSFYNLAEVGLKFPGLSPQSKSYLWKSVCVPTLVYGLDVLPLKASQINQLNSFQGGLLKQCLGLGKRSRHSKLLQAMNIKPIEHIFKEMTSSLFSRIFNMDGPGRDLSTYFLATYLTTGKLYEGTLLQQIVSTGFSPLNVIFDYCKPVFSDPVDGIVDSLRALLCHDNFLKMYSDR